MRCNVKLCRLWLQIHGVEEGGSELRVSDAGVHDGRASVRVDFPLPKKVFQTVGIPTSNEPEQRWKTVKFLLY